MSKYVTYVHIFPNGKRYYGQTCQKPEHRWGSDGCKYNKQPLMSRAIEKYGWDNVEHVVEHTGLSKEQADYFEQLCISTYRTNEKQFGYNITDGGEGTVGYKHSEETKRKIGEAARNMSEETRKNMSEAHKGKHYSEKTRKNMSEAHKGKHLSEETRKKLSETKKGDKNPMYGKPLSEEHRKKLNEGQKKRWEQYHKEGSPIYTLF